MTPREALPDNATQPGDSLDGTGNRLAGDMEDAVDIEQDAGHRRHSHRRDRGAAERQHPAALPSLP